MNGIDGDPNHDGRGSETHTLQIPAVTRIQEACIKPVGDVVNDLDNVLYEVSNQSDPQSQPWQYHMIQYVKAYGATRSKQHPVGMTVTWPNGCNDVLDESPADWISPNHEGGYVDAPPATTGRKVILSDTDHLWGIGGTRSGRGRVLMRGLNVPSSAEAGIHMRFVARFFKPTSPWIPRRVTVDLKDADETRAAPHHLF